MKMDGIHYTHAHLLKHIFGTTHLINTMLAWACLAVAVTAAPKINPVVQQTNSLTFATPAYLSPQHPPTVHWPTLSQHS